MFECSGGLFLLTSFHFLLFFVIFLLLVTFVNYFFTVEGSLFIFFCIFLLLITYVNYFLLLKGAR
jgi:hypothetical protein